GTPASSTDQHPMNIMYASPGFYDVTLIVTNGAYSDTIVKADYIVVTSELWPDPDGFCDTISNITSNDFPLGFRHLAPTKWGYFPGHNGYSIKAYAEKFTNYTFSNVQGMIVPVVKAYSASSNPKVRFTVWDVDTTGMPGNIIEYKDVQIGSFTPYLYHSVIFDNPAEIDGEFFVGFQVYYYTPQDTFAVYMAPNRGIGGENSLYVKKATWTTPSVILNDTLNTSLGIDLIGCLVEKEEITLEDNINIYPNPTSGIVNISFSDMETGNVKVMVYDIYGRVVLNGPVVEYMQDYTLNLSEMDSGLYLISIEADGLILNRKITLVK
ncbi:MAG: T9SS type A sorting domain-containing protein, partial [Bacteroidota bacterium]